MTFFKQLYAVTHMGIASMRKRTGPSLVVVIGMAAVAGMTNLRKLYARDTFVTDEGLKHLSGLRELTELDKLIAVWEWRSGPTPWLVMTPRDFPQR